MIFIDTSAFYAVLDRDDQVHDAAQSTWVELLSHSNRPLITSNYVLVEAFALIQARLGMEAVRTFHDDVLPVLRVEWVNPADHTAAAQAVLAANRRGLSLLTARASGSCDASVFRRRSASTVTLRNRVSPCLRDSR